MICNNCGYERPDDMPVCPNCGPGSKAFAADEQEAQQSGAAAEAPVPEPAQQTAEPARQTVPELEKAGVGVNMVRRVAEEGINPCAFIKRNRRQRHP